ncbi:MAG TPA: adenylyltransferase/cytidyltransferase family protein [Dictyobacter sp.]|nr:adenylyltransferase/cytidyltransferase family protein [Dictyobacter sp.]
MSTCYSQTRQKIILSHTDLAAEVRRRQAQGERAVFTNGCFDLLHLGHIRYLQDARDLGDFLILGLNSDGSVRTLKGLTRPLVSEDERSEIMAALSCIDYVTIFADATASPLIDELQPDIYVKGGDYQGSVADGAFDPQRLPEGAHVLAYGGQVRLIPYIANHSTTELVAKIKAL